MNYRKAFFGVAIIAVVLAAALIETYTRRTHPEPAPETASQQTATLPSGSAGSSHAQQPAESAAPNLSPVQLSPQRLQSIGVKFAEVTRKTVNDEIRVTGSVDVNEERLAY